MLSISFLDSSDALMKKAEALLESQIKVATKLASKPPFSQPGQSAKPEVIATLAAALATNCVATASKNK